MSEHDQDDRRAEGAADDPTRAGADAAPASGVAADDDPGDGVIGARAPRAADPEDLTDPAGTADSSPSDRDGSAGTAGDEDAEDAGDEPTARPGGRRGGPLRVAAVVLLVLAIAFAGWAGVRFLGTDEAAADTANTRDDALRAARSEIIQFNTLDYRTASDVYAGWLAISTGKLREDLVAAQQAQVQRLTTARTVTRAEIDDLGVVDLDAGRGTATVIAAVRTTVTPEGAEGVTKRVRIQAELARTDQGWLLSSIGQVDI